MDSLSQRHEKALALTAQYGQDHLLRFYRELSPVEQASLLDQIFSVDFEQVAALHRDLVLTQTSEKNSGAAGSETIEPMRAKAWEEYGIAERASMANQGMRALRDGKVAAFLVAGGQGTRLG